MMHKLLSRLLGQPADTSSTDKSPERETPQRSPGRAGRLGRRKASREPADRPRQSIEQHHHGAVNGRRTEMHRGRVREGGPIRR
jgi:hypothetical protein